MAKKKESFVLTAVPEDLGVMQYGFVQGGKKANNNNTGERKNLWRSPASIFLLTVSAFLVFWFLYTVIADMVRNGAQAVLSHFVDFFVLGVCVAIVIISIGKFWGRFARFALRHNLVRSGERAGVEDSAEMMENYYEKLEKEPPVFEVYENYIRVTDGDGVKTFERAHVGKIVAYKSHGRCFLVISADDERAIETVWLFDVYLPLREVKKLQAIFGDKLSIEPLNAAERGAKARLDDFRESLSEVNWPGIIMGLIAMAVGGGVIALHYTVAENIPIALGAFFMAGGVLVFFTGLSSLPVVKVFIIPLLFGGILLTVPWQFCKIIAETTEVPIVFTSVDNFLSSFNAMFCAVGFFGAMGLLAVISAFTGLVKFIKYGEY